MARALYNLVLYAASPLLLALFFLRGISAPEYWRRWPERFGFISRRHARPVWVHCASVGEFQAALPLIQALKARHGEILVTTFTATGSARVDAALGGVVHHVYQPFDLKGAVARFIERANPRLALVMETELWPNLYNQCRRHGVPVVLANARLSPRSFRLYRWLAPLVAHTLDATRVIAARSEEDANRIIALGADPGRVTVVGDIKFDLSLEEGLFEVAAAFRRAWGPRPVWIAASTHAGEDEQVLDAFGRVRLSLPEAALILVPRHPERFAPVAALARECGYRVALRRADTVPSPATDIFVADTLGELSLFYAAADVAFVGGSLMPVGGHNPLEPAAVGLPVIVGPHTFNFRETVAVLAQAEALRVTYDSSQLAAAIVHYLEDEAERNRAGESARQAVARNRGALARLLALLRPYME